LESYIKYIVSFFFVFIHTIGFSQEIQFTDQEKKWIAEHPVIEFGYDPRWEPYEVYTHGQYGGIISEYIKIIEKKTGIEMNPIPDMTWDKSLKGLIEGSIMVVPSCVSTPERKELFDLSDPYIQDPIVIVAPKHAPYFSTLGDLKGKSVSLTKGYYANELIKSKYPEINIIEFESIEDCFKSLINGKSDAFVGKLNVITYYINHYGFDNIKIVGTTPFQDDGVCFGINPEWKTFTGIVNKVIAHITPEQKHEIRQKWIAGKGRKIYSPTFFIWSISITLSVLVLLIFAYYWNRSLKRKLKAKKAAEYQLKTLLIEVKKSDEEKKILLQEIHHRVKNNLQIVSSMLNLQANTTNDEKTRQVLKEAMDRVASIALVHKKMYQSPSNDIIDIKNYAESLFNDILLQYQSPKHIKLKISAVDNINSTMASIIPLALILNELITNSIKYAFHSQETPEITIDFTTDISTNKLRMKYTDNGTWVENEESDNFGTSMIEIFTEQVDGSFTITKEKNLTTYLFNFDGVKIN